LVPFAGEIVQAVKLPHTLDPRTVRHALHIRERHQRPAILPLERHVVAAHDGRQGLGRFNAKQLRRLLRGQQTAVGEIGQRLVKGAKHACQVARLGHAPRRAQILA
jgi:hypothetical protein